MAIKKNELYSSLWASCDKLRGGMDASQQPILCMNNEIEAMEQKLVKTRQSKQNMIQDY